MAKMIQIRNVPEELHRKLKARAAEEGMTLSDYLLAEAKELARKPSTKAMMERLSRLPPVTLTENPADILRRHRDAE